MASNVERYAKAATDLSDAASAQGLLSRHFRPEQVAGWVEALRSALGIASLEPVRASERAPATAREVATRQAGLERQRRRVVTAARNLITELKRVIAAVEPIKHHLAFRPGEGSDPLKAALERIQDAAFVSTHLGVPLGLAMIDPGALSDSLERTIALADKLTRWSALDRPPQTKAKAKGARNKLKARDGDLAMFLAMTADADLKPKQLAALECLARNEFAVTSKRRSNVAWAATKIREWEKTLARTKPEVEDLLFWATYSPEMEETAVARAPGE